MNQLLAERQYVREYKEKVADAGEKIRQSLDELVRGRIQRKKQGIRKKLEGMHSADGLHAYLTGGFEKDMAALDEELGEAYMRAIGMLEGIAGQAYGELAEKAARLHWKAGEIPEGFGKLAQELREQEKRKAAADEWKPQKVKTADMGISRAFGLEQSAFMPDRLKDGLPAAMGIGLIAVKWLDKKKKEAWEQVEEKMDSYERRAAKQSQDYLLAFINGWLYAADRLTALCREMDKGWRL